MQAQISEDFSRDLWNHICCCVCCYLEGSSAFQVLNQPLPQSARSSWWRVCESTLWFLLQSKEPNRTRTQLHSILENLPAGFTTTAELSNTGDALHNSSGDVMKTCLLIWLPLKPRLVIALWRWRDNCCLPPPFSLLTPSDFLMRNCLHLK